MRDAPFYIEISPNVQKFVFSENWDHTRHYRAIFNGLDDVLEQHMPKDSSWGMIGDWRNWLVQIPESERLCVRCLGQLGTSGMTHYATVVEDHPVARWQLDKVAKQNPHIEVKAFTSFEDAEAWLKSHGFDCEFTSLGFKQDWLRPSERFVQTLDDLDVDKDKFELT